MEISPPRPKIGNKPDPYVREPLPCFDSARWGVGRGLAAMLLHADIGHLHFNQAPNFVLNGA